MKAMLVDLESLGLFGACLANNGINILTNECCISKGAIHAINPIIMNCGMSIRAGHFVQEYGLPCIYALSGAIMSVIPGLGAMIFISP